MVTLPQYIGEESRRPPWSLAASLRRVFSFPVLLGCMLIAGCFAVASDSILDPDTWWHTAVGQRILATHSWPWSDAYSGTLSGTPWIAYEWLGDVIMGAAASVGGLRGATLLLIALSGILILLLYHYTTLRCGNSKAAFVASATLIPVLGAFFTLRPQLIGTIFLVLTLIILERFRQGQERALWFLPLVFLCWVNTHGSFVFGFFVIGVVWLCGQFEFSSGGIAADSWTKRQSVQLLLAVMFSALVLPITPYGSRVAAYPLSMALTQPINVQNIQEWLPLGMQTFAGKYFLGVVLLFFVACLTARPSFRFSEVALALFGVFVACMHLRFLLLFVIFFSPLWATLFARWAPRYKPEEDHPIVNACLIVAIAVGFTFLFPSRQKMDREIDKDYPRAALQYLAGHPIQGRFFNEYSWGGYLIWAGVPKNMIFIDGRADIYEYGGVLPDYLDIARVKPNTLELLKKYDIEACLIPKDAPLGTVLSGRVGWERIYQDSLSALYVRQPEGRLAASTSAAVQAKLH